MFADDICVYVGCKEY